MHRPFGLSALFRVSLTAALLLAASQTSRAQLVETKNQYVAGRVEAATGILTVMTVVNNKATIYLTNPGHSYLSISCNGRWYTNNNAGGANLVGNLGGGGSAVTPIPLDGGTTRMVADTVVTTFNEGGGAFDIVQEVYPVAFRASGQIVLRVKIVNHSSSAVSVDGLQWMNDVQAGTNDNPFLFERNYYDANRWRVAAKDGTNPAPPSFYLETEKDPGTIQFGQIGVGFTNDSFPPSPMGLTPCTGFAVVSWQGGAVGGQGLDYIYGCPAPPSPPNSSDLACILQWKPISVPAAQGHDTTIEEFRTSFGTDEFCKCLSNVVSINIFPTHLTYDQITHKYTPNPFNVLSMVFNAAGNAISSVTSTHKTNGSVRIVRGGSGAGKANGGQTSSYSGATIAPGQMKDFVWTDSTLPNTNCNGQGSFDDMVFELTGSGFGGSWDCSQPGNHNGTCDVLVDCADVDLNPPAHSAHSAVIPAGGGSFVDTTFVVNDKRASDYGLDTIIVSKVSYIRASDTSTFKVTISPKPPYSCSKADFTIDVRQMDSLIGGYVGFKFLDCAHNWSYDTVWFKRHFNAPPPDVYKPEFSNKSYSKQNSPIQSGTGCNSNTNYQQSDWIVWDTINKPYAHGLKFVRMISNNNAIVVVDAFGVAPESVHFSFAVKDTFQDADACIEAIDTAGNKDTFCIHYCTVQDTIAPIIGTPVPTGPHSRKLHITDEGGWNRGLKTVRIVNGTNVRGIPSDVVNLNCDSAFDFEVQAIDPNQLSCFQVEAIDCALGSNKATSGVICMGQDTDVNCPKITVTPDANSVILMHVTISDTQDQFEQGIDSVWFTGVKNMKLTYNGSTEAHCPGDPATTFATIHGAPSGIPRPTFQKTVSFDLEICDTNNIDVNQACVTIYWADGAGHQGCSTPYPYVWCVPLTVDALPPLIRDSNATCSAVSFIAEDNRPNDRGLSRLTLSNAINLTPFDYTNLQGGERSGKTVSINVITKGKSASADISAIDAFGAKSSDPTVQAAHSASGKFWLYAQDLVMKAGHVFLTEGDYDVKILLDTTDLIKSLKTKNIWKAEFSFHLDGDTENIHFVTAKPGAFAPNWNVSVKSTAGQYTVTATGAPLPDMAAGDNVLLLLTFHANSTPNTGAARIVLDPVACGSESYAITYNGGADTGAAFVNTTMTMHAPFGNMNGGVLTIKGNCTPFASTGGALPTAISMSPIQPNPAWKGTPSLHVMYTIADEGLVKMNLYNTLGEKVRTVISESQKQGEYQIDIPSSDLPEGMYFLRLEAGGLMITRRVVLGGE